MPIGIDAEAQGLGGLGVVGLHFATFARMTDERSSMVASDVKAHIAGISLQITVTIDTTTELGVLNQSTFVTVGETCFVDAHLGVGFVAWLNQTIGNAVVDAVGTDVDAERCITAPTFGELGSYLDKEAPTLILLKEFVPLVCIDAGRLLALGMQFARHRACEDSIDHQHTVALHGEVQGSNVDRNGYSTVVRIDLRLLIDHLRVLHLLHATSAEQHRARANNIIGGFHVFLVQSNNCYLLFVNCYLIIVIC